MHFQNEAILSALLDRMNFAIFVVDDERRPLYANARGSALLSQARVFHLDKLGSLRLVGASDDKALRESISAARHAKPADRPHPIPVHGTASSPAMFAWVLRLPLEADADEGRQAATSVMITRRSLNAVGQEVLGDLFGLTSAESRLVQSMLQGLSPSQYAAQRGLSQNTVRNQLKSIFEKTDVRRQSDLVNLLWNVLLPVNFEPSGD